MSSQFASPAWQSAIAALVGSHGAAETADALAAAVAEIVNLDGTCLLAFHRDAAPEVLHHTLEPKEAKHYLERYLAGPYLLDPLYQLALRATKPGMCRFRDEAPDRFRSSEYYRQYCERTHLGDEMDFLVDVGGAGTLAYVVGRYDGRFSRAETKRLGAVEDIVHAAMRRVWRNRESASGATASASMHARLTRCFDEFGHDVLTRREREITKLLLRGFSTKSIANHLDIAPGTVMVHKRNLFAKLGITSQYELFSRFIESLS